MQNFTKVGLPLVALAAAIIAYLVGYLPELGVGFVLAAAIVLLPGLYAARLVGGTASSANGAKAMLVVAGLATILAAIPIYFAFNPGAAQYSGQLNDTQKSVSLGLVTPGAYVMTAEGSFGDGDSDVTADYRLKVQNGEKSEFVDGSLGRSSSNVRVGKSGTARQTHVRTRENHSLTLAAANTDIVLVKASSDLKDGLHFELYRVLLPANLFWGLAVLIFMVAAVLEAKFASEKNRSVLTATLGFVLLLGYWIPDQMLPQMAVRRVVGSAIMAGLTGVLGAGVISWLMRRLLKPKDDAQTKSGAAKSSSAKATVKAGA